MPGSPPIAGDILEVEVLTLQGNQIGVNMLHYAVRTTVAPVPSLQQIANAVDNALHIQYKQILNNTATYRGVAVANVSGLRTTQFIANPNAGGGSAGASALPTQVRGVLSYYTQLAGPRYRGRSYIPFPPTIAGDSSGMPTAGYVTFLAILLVAIVGPIVVPNGGGSASLGLVVAHRNGLVYTGSDVVTAYARNKFATQRKSGAYGRPNLNPF